MTGPLSELGIAINDLLPLTAIEVNVRFIEPSSGGVYHQPTLTAFLRHLLGGVCEYETHFSIDAPETGITHYRAGDKYRFVLFVFPIETRTLDEILTRFLALPDRATEFDSDFGRFGRNLILENFKDHWTGATITEASQLSSYKENDLNREAKICMSAGFLAMRWRSPVRLKRVKSDETLGLSGESRYCQEQAQVSGTLLVERLFDALANLLRNKVGQAPRRFSLPQLKFLRKDLYWISAQYHNVNGERQKMGGLSGVLTFPIPDSIDEHALKTLVLGQYVGIGQRRAFGWGRYQLEQVDGGLISQFAVRNRSLLERIAESENMLQAYKKMHENLSPQNRQTRVSYEQMLMSGFNEESAADHLVETSVRLAAGRYKPAQLSGLVISEPDGDFRALAIPPFYDRVAQRAVSQVLGSGLDKLMYEGSFGYRPGKSRADAKRLIEANYAKGYIYAYESDIEDYFDCIDWWRLENRLRSIYLDDSVIELVMSWVKAPVLYEGELVQRRRGVPQGSPISPLLANLFLDDFDTDIISKGFKLVRYADDFVILCKSEQEAAQADMAVRASLAEIGLQVNESKTAIRAFKEGFRFLGYLFVNGLTLNSPNRLNTQAQANDKTVNNPEVFKGWLGALAKRKKFDFKHELGAELVNAISHQKEITLGDDSLSKSTLFVTGPVCWVSTKLGRIEVKREDNVLSSTPWKNLRSVVLVGAHHISTPALRAAMFQLVPVHFANSVGRFQGTAGNQQAGSEGSQLWLQQLAWFSDERHSLEAAKSLVESRVRHMRETLRQRDTDKRCEAQLSRLKESIESINNSQKIETLRGVEGNATRVYFQSLAKFIPKEFGFDHRNKRPPRDPFNVLLSLGYTVLYSHVDTAIRARGLLPVHGFYHKSRGKHSALASDLMEPFRHYVERCALNAIANHSLQIDDFFLSEKNMCTIETQAKRKYLMLLAQRFELPVKAKGSDTAQNLLTHVDQQIQQLVEWMLGREDAFIAWRYR